MTRHAEVVICGAGIAGVSAAYFLARAGFKDILLLDERPPLTLTSSHSTECYRNWWPEAEMVALMNRSIDLMEELAEASGNAFRMNRRGYLYLTAEEERLAAFQERARHISNLGAGPLRIHPSDAAPYQPAPAEGFGNQPDGADLLLGSERIRRYFPYLTERVVAGLHVRRAGWLSAQQLGMYLLERARRLGVRFERQRVEAVETRRARVRSVRLSTGTRVHCPLFVNAAGPFLKPVGEMLGVSLPVYTELHGKVAFKDSLGVVGRGAPLLIWEDAQPLPWSAEEHATLYADPETRPLTAAFPPGAHTRPEGGNESQTILMLWEYQPRRIEAIFPPPLDDLYAEIVLRGLSTMLPGLRQYFGKMPRPQIDGGYYTRTRENRPLIGPLSVDGAYVIGALSGFGIMAACSAGELLALHISGGPLPSYAKAFSPARYADPEYQQKLEQWRENGQL